jgi:thiol:disulfide interchange protein
MLALNAGCSPGIAWRAFAYDTKPSDPARAGKVVLVYFRHWAVVQCTEFEEKVLKDPAVLAATSDLYCIVLDYRVDKKRADQWGVTQPPGIALLGPDGRLLDRSSGMISAAALADMIDRARNAATRPASRPAGS